MSDVTVEELRQLLAPLPDDAPIFVNGYEGGYDMPRLEQAMLTTLLPWVHSSSYTGPWNDSRTGDGPLVWVLARGDKR